jgi:hypothetical protein
MLTSGFTRVEAKHRAQVVRDWRWPRRVAMTIVVTSGLIPLASVDAAASVVTPTTSYYETSASTAVLGSQGQAAGQSGTQGLVVLDFGRPASDGTSDGTLDFSHAVLSFADITSGVQSYVMGYYNAAPVDTRLDVVVGTNDSCGSYQPCGSVVCGCPDEPSSYITWGQDLANTVEQLNAWSARVAASNGYTDTVHVWAGDDAEPAFDPGFENTKYVMQGYAQAVGGSYPPMVDYGSADPGIWTNDQLLQIANGFSPNVAMPEMYTPSQVAEWASVLSYAKTHYGEEVTLFGVMTVAASTEAPQNAAADTLAALAPVTGQGSIRWVSTITH